MKVIIADLDRELSDNSHIEANLEYMSRPIQKNKYFILNTAFSKEHADSLIQENGINYSYLSICNGRAIFDNTGKFCRGFSIDNGVFEQTERFVKRFKGVHITYIGEKEFKEPRHDDIFSILLDIENKAYNPKLKKALKVMLSSNGLDSKYELVSFNDEADKKDGKKFLIRCCYDSLRPFAYDLSKFDDEDIIDTRKITQPFFSLEGKVKHLRLEGPSE